jgi:hypothetical protein
MLGTKILLHIENTLVDGYIESLIDSFFAELYNNSCVRIFVILLSFEDLICYGLLLCPAKITELGYVPGTSIDRTC